MKSLTFPDFNDLSVCIRYAEMIDAHCIEVDKRISEQVEKIVRIAPGRFYPARDTGLETTADGIPGLMSGTKVFIGEDNSFSFTLPESAFDDCIRSSAFKEHNDRQILLHAAINRITSIGGRNVHIVRENKGWFIAFQAPGKKA